METNPLTVEQMRAIIRAHPVTAAALANCSAASPEAASVAATEILMSNPVILDAIVAAGCGISEVAARRMGLLRWLTAFQVLTATAQSTPPAELLAVLTDELGALTGGTMGTMQ